MSLNNNQIYSIVNEAYKQALGTDAIDTIDLQDFVDTGSAYSAISANKDQFTSALINISAKNWFSDKSYRSQYSDPFFEESREMGAIIQFISATVPEVKESHSWKTFTSGVSTLGAYTLYMPLVETKYYGKTVSWELPIAITDEQWDDAFRTTEALSEFVSYIMMMVDNAIVCHIEDMNALNRNNFLAEKIEAQNDGVAGVHAINLIALYNSERGKSISTVEEFLADGDALRFASATIDEYSTYFSKMSTLFNTAGKPRFTPDDRKVIQIVKKFAKAISEVALSGTFNAQYVELPNYTELPSWQGFGATASWDDVTSIDVEISSDGTAVKKSGIVACIVDKWAIMHTIRKHRTAVTRFDPEAISQYYFQFRDSYMNDLTMNGLIFYLEDVTP